MRQINSETKELLDRLNYFDSLENVTLYDVVEVLREKENIYIQDISCLESYFDTLYEKSYRAVYRFSAKLLDIRLKRETTVCYASSISDNETYEDVLENIIQEVCKKLIKK